MPDLSFLISDYLEFLDFELSVIVNPQFRHQDEPLVLKVLIAFYTLINNPRSAFRAGISK